MRSHHKKNEVFLSPENPNRDEKKFSSYAIKLIHRLLPIADTDCTGITIQDRQWLEDVLNGRTCVEIARCTKLSPQFIYKCVKNALDTLCQKIDMWDDSAKRIPALNARIQQLEDENLAKDNRLNELSNDLSLKEEESLRLRNILDKYVYCVKNEASAIKPIDAGLKIYMDCQLKAVKIPRAVYSKLARHGIHKVIELIRYTYPQLLLLKGITERDASLIKSRLETLGLQLGSDIRWVSGVEDYFLFSPDTADPDVDSDAPSLSYYNNLQIKYDELVVALKGVKAELELHKAEQERLRKLEKENSLMNLKISSLEADNEKLKERNRNQQETIVSYIVKEGEVSFEESKRVKELKDRINELEDMLKRLRKQGRIAVATLDFLND